MNTGKQLATLLLLSTALTFPAAAFAQDGDEQTSSPADIVDEEEVMEEEPEISIPGGNTIIVTGRINRDPTRSSSQVLEVLSSEQIARTGEGDIAGALGRVTGLSVVGNGRVYVRGLGDRYSLALLNGLPLPSPEPLSRVVPLDIFPTNIVASSLVQKTYSANFPGEFGGGVINLTTRAIPTESFVKLSVGISGDSETTFQPGNDYYGSGTDWTGFDNGARDLSPQLQTYLDESLANGSTINDLFANPEELAATLTPASFATLQQIGDLRPNFSGGITAGTSVELGDDMFLGIIATGSISNKYRNRSIFSQQANTDLSQLTEDFLTNVTNNNILVNGMLGFGLEFSDHVIRWTNLYIRDTVKQSRLSAGRPAIVGEPDRNAIRQNTAWYERQLIDTQLVGEFEFDRLSVDLRGGFAQTQREAPYNLNYEYIQTNVTSELFGEYFRIDLDRDQQIGEITVSFSDLQEELYFAGIDLGYELADNLSVSAGYAYTDTQRSSQRRSFLFDASPDQIVPDDPNVDPIDLPIEVFQALGIRSPGLILNAATYQLAEVTVDDTTISDPAFDAGLEIQAGYGQFQWAATDRLSVQAGVRFETSLQSTTPVGALNVATPITVGGGRQDNWLPGATITFEPVDDLQLRASASKTLARPQFRELIAQLYFDPETNRSYRGNPFLIDSDLLNLEARAEYYAGGGSQFSLAGFYKKIDNPIEAFLAPEQGTLVTSYVNVPKAVLYGAELDVTYMHDLFEWGGWFENKQFVLIANYTYTQSELQIDAGDETLNQQGVSRPTLTFFPNGDGAPLVGQSDHIANVQLGLEDMDILQQFTVLLNYASKRVSTRGANGRPDVVVDPGFTVDLIARQGFNLLGAEAELKLEARNILGRDHEEYQANATNRIEINSYDVGRSFSAGLSITF